MTTTGPDSKVRGANMRPTWGRQDPGGPHVGPVNFGIWGLLSTKILGDKMQETGGLVITFCTWKTPYLTIEGKMNFVNLVYH